VAKVRELRDLGDADLVERLDSSKEELFNLRFQLATGQLDNPMRIGEVRHEIARILTILRERELEQQAQELEAGETEDAGTAEETPAEAGTPRRSRLRRKQQQEAS
jgi:large subunit ribosomal protein L29